MEEKKFVFKRGFTDSSLRELVIHEDYLRFKDKNAENPFAYFKSNEIKDYRYGIRWIRFELTYGREYQIFVRNIENQVIKLSFKSYFGRKKKLLHSLYNNILDELWDNYFGEMANQLIQQFENGETITVGGVFFKKEGIELNISGIFSEKKTEIAWEDIRTKNYYTYFSVYSEKNPAKINRGYNYGEDWNTAVLYSVLRTILRNKGIEKYS